MDKQISYTAVLLDAKSASLLAEKFKKLMPEGWDWYAHHMTITMGAMDDAFRQSLLGKEITLQVETLGMDDKVMAVGVTGFYSKNKNPHVTLAVNKAGGGKPMMSNLIPEANWKAVEHFAITGKITEFPMPEKKSLTEGYDVKALPFFKDVAAVGGKIYQVGGAVRDTYLGKESKDLDILVTGVKADQLNKILAKYGKVDMVGASFGVIKFTPPGGEEVDIALPRTEKKVGTGYQGFDVTADHTLPVEKDLGRRDFTINSIAKDSEGNIIDPHGGVDDLGAKVIRLTNPEAFVDDPLRMVRAVQFASRFKFTIEGNTFKMIQDNAKNIAEISKERILIEFDKIVHKGDPKIGAQLLVESNLYEHIFGTKFTGEFEPFLYVKRMSEFIYWLTECFTDQPDQYFKDLMKGEDRITREISALSYLYKNIPGNDVIKGRWCTFNLNRLAPSIFASEFVKSHLEPVMNDFATRAYPANLSQLAVNGNDMMEMGMKGKQVGDALTKIIGAVYSDEITNDKSEILKFLSNRDMMTEEMTQKEKKVAFYDFDATIMDSPHPELGKKIYQQKKGVPYPHKGWWGRDESLDLDVFDIQPHCEVEAHFRKDAADPYTHTVLLTNRISKNGDAVKKVLAKHGMVFDIYSFKNDSREKGERVKDIMATKFPDIKKIVFYDDDHKHIQNVHDNLIDSDIDYKVNHVVNGSVSK